MKYIATLYVMALATWSSFTSAEVVEVDGVARAYFPGGVYETTLDTQQIKGYAHADEDAMVFYTLNAFRGHGAVPSADWLSRYAEGQESTVTDAVSGVTRVEHDGDRMIGEFFLEGNLQGVRYEKVCAFIMNHDDHGSWCVAVLGESPDTKRAVDDYLMYSDSFQLLE